MDHPTGRVFPCWFVIVTCSTVTGCGGRPHSQRRVRPGFTPGSLRSPTFCQTLDLPNGRHQKAPFLFKRLNTLGGQVVPGSYRTVHDLVKAEKETCGSRYKGWVRNWGLPEQGDSKYGLVVVRFHHHEPHIVVAGRMFGRCFSDVPDLGFEAFRGDGLVTGPELDIQDISDLQVGHEF